MAVHKLKTNHLLFPEPTEFDEDIVAYGGDLRPARILEAYSRGIFPWYNEPGEYIWFSPNIRSVLYCDELHISRSMQQIIKSKKFTCTVDMCFKDVMEGCRSGSRKHDTWIFDETIEAYTALHHSGFAHSVEVWQDGVLVGGLYGGSLGRMFFGESMYSAIPNASKFAFIWLAQKLDAMGWPIIDCQVPTSHLSSLGTVSITRNHFLKLLNAALEHPPLVGNWSKLQHFQD
ncbi:MAG: leucyl/phenylalanyl-tRNA--protein transferase [Flavobacteriales bacterium]